MYLEKLFWKLKKNRLIRIHENISKKIVLGDRFQINCPSKLNIHEYVYIGPNVWIDARGGLEIQRGAILGPRVKIHTFNHRYENCETLPYDKIEIYKPVKIAFNVWIGSDVIILPGTLIGEGCIISSGSVVRGTLEKCGIYAGNPAKKVGSRNENDYRTMVINDRIYLKDKFGQ